MQLSNEWITIGWAIEGAAIELVNRFDRSRPVRLLGVRAEMLPPEQPAP